MGAALATNEEWSRRLRDAKRDYEKNHDTRLTFKEIGVRVAALVGRAEPFKHTSARAWFEEGQEPDAFAVAEAIALVLEADPAALVFGTGEATPAAQLPPRQRGKSIPELLAEKNRAASDEGGSDKQA